MAFEDPSCPFCAIGRGDQQAAIAWQDDQAVAFLDRAPLFPGHLLVVPTAHVVTLGDLPPATVGPFFERVRWASVAVPEAVGAVGSFVAANNVVSQSVAHLHVHVVPRRPKDGLRGFFWPRTRYASDDEMGAVAASVGVAMRRLAMVG
jgi:histidine triad (HIT) family protein